MKLNVRQVLTSFAAICISAMVLRAVIALVLGRTIETAMSTEHVVQTVMIAAGVSLGLALLSRRTA